MTCAEAPSTTIAANTGNSHNSYGDLCDVCDVITPNLPKDEVLRIHRGTSGGRLGGSALFAMGAVSGSDGGEVVKLAEDAAQTQAAPVAFGRVSLRVVMNRWAAVTRVTWWCHPAKVRPSKWAKPSPVFSSR